MKKSPGIENVPLNIVGSNVFGRYPKISVEQTWNMIISDDWLVPYAGYKNIASIAMSGKGRGIFNSVRLGKMIAVVNNGVYVIANNIAVARIGSISTFSGDVFIDENDANQIAICDKQDIYIFDYIDNTFQKAPLDFTPGYITFQNGYFIAPDISSIVGSPKWRLSALNDGLSWPNGANNVGLFQTKPDQAVACIRFPGKGNLLFVMGKTVTEAWYDVGGSLFPYQRSSSYNIDYGCLNSATIATGDTFIVWLGGNEKSGPAIMFSDGGNVLQLSNDGINFKLAELNNPSASYGFLFKQDGHLLYQITFSDPSDNLTLTFDFTTKRFYSLCNENMDIHIARRIAFFNNSYYFVSSIDGNLYELNSKYNTYNYGTQEYEIPRIRIPATFRLPDTSPFMVNNIVFPIEQGTTDEQPRVDLSISVDGGMSFGNSDGMLLNPKGKYMNQFIYWNLGYCNEFTPQFRLWGKGRFVAGNGTMGVYQ